MNAKEVQKQVAKFFRTEIGLHTVGARDEAQRFVKMALENKPEYQEKIEQVFAAVFGERFEVVA